MIRIGGTYEFNVLGDGAANEIRVPLKALTTPAPLRDGQLPSKLGVAKVLDSENVVTAVLDKDASILTLTFETPPDRSVGTRVSVECLFGGE